MPLASSHVSSCRPKAGADPEIRIRRRFGVSLGSVYPNHPMAVPRLALRQRKGWTHELWRNRSLPLRISSVIPGKNSFLSRKSLHVGKPGQPM